MNRRRAWWRRSGRDQGNELIVPVVMAGYAGPNFGRRHRRPFLAMLLTFSFFYGATFALFTTFAILQLTVPLVILLLISIWLLPDTNRAPFKTLTRLMFAFLVLTSCWPNYLAIAIPGMPWITMNRLVTLPLALVMLVAVSTATKFRAGAKQIIATAPYVWKLLCIFAVLAFLSIFVSNDIAVSTNKFIIAQLSWTLIFFTAAIVIARPGNATRLSYTLWVCSIIVCAIGFLEWRQSALPWAGHIPSFLKIDDPTVERVVTATTRSATGAYRVKSVFTTPLALGEYLAFATPFIWAIALTSKRLFIKLAAVASIPLVFAILIGTDSRLGMIGFFMTALLYVLAWGVMRWRDQPERIIGRVVVLTYPALAAGFFVLSLFWTRLSNMIWGGGATIPSSLARKEQWASGIPKIIRAPWGHGIGQGGDTLGYIGGGGVGTIDSYYLSILLEYGVIGFIVYFGAFIAALYYGVRALLKSSEPEARLLIPLLIALANFAVIKSVFSQEGNHPIVFCLLGAVVALIYRVEYADNLARRVQEQRVIGRIALPGGPAVVVDGR